MSLGRSKEEQALTDLLAKTLVVKEVMEPMQKIGWGHSNPPPPDYSGQPAPVEGAPGQSAAPAPESRPGQPGTQAAAAPAQAGQAKADSPTVEELIAAYESAKDPVSGLYFGKYKTIPEAVKGGVHLVSMAKQAFGERDTAVKQLREIEALGSRQAPTATPVVVPQSTQQDAPSRVAVDAAQARLDKVLSEVVENGGVLDADASKAISRAQRELADAAADLRVQETFSKRDEEARTEKNVWADVDAHMKREHPQAERFTDEVALHMQGNPLLNSAVQALLSQGKRLDATILAWKDFERSHVEAVAAVETEKAEDREADLAAREQVRKELVEKARRDAGVVTGSAGGSGNHENRNAAGSSREEIEAARNQMRLEGDSPGSPAAMRFRAMVIGPSLDPSIFGSR